MVKATFFSCYSINLLRFLKANGLVPMSKGVNKTTSRTFWVFVMTDELSNLLTIWSNSKKDK